MTTHNANTFCSQIFNQSQSRFACSSSSQNQHIFSTNIKINFIKERLHPVIICIISKKFAIFVDNCVNCSNRFRSIINKIKMSYNILFVWNCYVNCFKILFFHKLIQTITWNFFKLIVIITYQIMNILRKTMT